MLSYRSAPFGGGQGVFVYELSKALHALGHKVDVISGPPYPNLDPVIELTSLPGLDLFSTFNFRERCELFFHKKRKNLDDYYEFLSVLLGNFPELETFGRRAKDLLKTNDYDVIIDNQSISFGMLDLQKHTPLIEVIHHPITKDYEYDMKFSKGILQKLSKFQWFSFLRMQKKVAKQIALIVTPSQNSRTDIAKDFSVPISRISVIHNGIDFHIFKPMLEIDRIPHKLITTASADVPLKGLDYSLEAMVKLKARYPEIQLTVIGAPRAGGHTERLIKLLQLESSVTFKSNLTRKEIAEEYASSSAAIVSSLYEGFGFPVGEAMACAIPLVATNVASIPEITGCYAQLIPDQCPTAITEAVTNIFSFTDKFQEKATDGRQHIIDNFNWDNIAKSYEVLIQDAIESFKKC